VWNQYHNQLNIYLSLAEGRTFLDVLDVGCAQATLAMLLAERGHRVSAVDIRQPFLDYAKSRYETGDIQFICANALEMDFPGRFDLIFANQIIEHLVYPKEFVSRLARLLKPRGRLVVTTPNGKYLKSSLPSYSELGDPCKYEHLQFTSDGDGHFFAFHRDELLDIFENAGLSRTRSTYFETPFISGHMKMRYFHLLAPFKLLSAFDRALLTLPAAGKCLSHQLMVTGMRA
jgi:SAM-dependent methyltransferase